MADFLPFTRPTIDEDMIRAVGDVLRSGWITTGPQVAGLESDLAAYIGGNRQVRVLTSATGALEIARAEKLIGASLQADPILYVHDPADRALLNDVDLAEIAITSDMTLSAEPPPAEAFSLPDVAGVGALINMATGEKCGRCWRVLDEVGNDPTHPELCVRCIDAVAGFRDAAE